MSTPTVPAPAAQQAPERPSAARRLLRDPVAISAAVTLLLWTATVLYSPPSPDGARWSRCSPWPPSSA
ncbi:hypothetical protein ACFQXA_05545 [Nocardiopsis composta]